MHNLSGLFFKEEATKILYDVTYYSFSLIFPDKKHTYFCTDKSEFKLWKKYLRLATNYSNILEMYEISKVIGEGSFSKVKLAINKVTKEKVAVKIIEKKKLSSMIIESTLTEIEIIKICQFPYIIKFIDAYENFEFIYIFMEYCPGGTLFEFLQKRDYTLSEKLCCNIIYKICLAVNYFHSYGINHRDLKPDNILMTSEDDDSEIRILDFGLGKIIGPSEKCSEPFGTIIFCAPEIILCKPYNKTVDSWSIGVITYALLFARLPFYDNYVKSGTYASQDRFSNFDRPFMELQGKRWGIIGLGNIGKKAAQIAKAFGCEVVYYSVTGKNTNTDYQRVDFDELLSTCDFISVHCPLSDLTRDLIDYETMKKMKKTAILINVARGPVVNNADLYRALTEGEIYAAGLDVLEKEPITEDNPLSQIKDSEKLIITPHMAWASTEARTRLAKEVYENIKAFINGEKRNIVNM